MKTFFLVACYQSQTAAGLGVKWVPESQHQTQQLVNNPERQRGAWSWEWGGDSGPVCPPPPVCVSRELLLHLGVLV